LEGAGKTVEMVLTDGVQSNFRFLQGAEKVSRKPSGKHDLSIVLDVSDMARVGEIFKDLKPDLVIDHHITNLNFGRINFIQPEAAATAVILARHLPAWGLKISQPVAEALMVGILTDTIGFRTSNVSPETLRVAADLVDLGADLHRFYYNAVVRRTFEAANYWGFALQKLERKGRLVWTSLTLAERAQSSYPGNDDADLTTILASIEGCDIAVLFIEARQDRIKVSWRASNGYDVSKLAVRFGGGGHKAAAGAEITGSLAEVQSLVLASTEAILNEQLSEREESGKDQGRS
jgi:bifunctional oligoribonuclease and PAP phosphatase NrnA